MAERVKFINRKRITLKTQLTNVEKILAENTLEPANIKARFSRVKELFAAYEELHDELALLIEPDKEALLEINDIQDRYYTLVAKFESLYPSTSKQCANELNATSVVIDHGTRRLKLPHAELPKFDGEFSKWLSFKNTFVAMIDSCDDMTGLQKFAYLKGCLQGDALNKISIYDVSEGNYESAWQLMLDSYNKPRILIVNHLDAILDLPVQTKATHKGLSILVDDMRQHVNMLATLDIELGEHLLVRILERALPNRIRAKWEETLDSKSTPTLDQIYNFITETAYRLYSIEQDKSHDKSEVKKRPFSGQEFKASKTQKTIQGARALMTKASTNNVNCSLCKGERHCLYKCPEFIKMTIRQRQDFAKRASLCRNCLRSHPGKCKYSHCRKCPKYHNTLLHEESVKSEASSSKDKNDGASDNLAEMKTKSA